MARFIMIRSDQAWRETTETIPLPRLASNVRRKAAKRGSRSFCRLSPRENRNRLDLRADCLRFRTCRGSCNLVQSPMIIIIMKERTGRREEERRSRRERDTDIIEASPILWYCTCFFFILLLGFFFAPPPSAALVREKLPIRSDVMYRCNDRERSDDFPLSLSPSPFPVATHVAMKSPPADQSEPRIRSKLRAKRTQTEIINEISAIHRWRDISIRDYIDRPMSLMIAIGHRVAPY